MSISQELHPLPLVPTKKTTKPRAPRKKPAPPPEETPTPDTVATWQVCVKAAESKKAEGIRVLDLRPITTFADFFVLCNGTNQRQVQAIADEVVREMKLVGERPASTEGYSNGEWILLDYGDLVVHVFSEKSRIYYDLDRLWRDATEVRLPASAS